MERKRRSRAVVRFGGFVLAGGTGFIVDAGLLAVGLALGLSAWMARIPSFLAAVVTTWLLNRRIAFPSNVPPTMAEFRNYLAAMSVGLLVNYLVYLGALTLGAHPLLALAIASGIGMVVNYLGARKVLDR